MIIKLNNMSDNKKRWEKSETADGITKRVSVEQVENAVFLDSFQPIPQQKYALIFGNEVYGVSQEAIRLSDGCIEIPQLGTKHSLNIAVSTGIVIWDFYQKMNK
jgi:tRNA G18 (ribose-2'-O)-methylase SpoU